MIGAAAPAPSTRSPPPLVSHAYGPRARGPLGIYNFAGDLGKIAMPPLAAAPPGLMSWRHALWVMAVVGRACRLGLAPPNAPRPRAAPSGASSGAGWRRCAARGFRLLLAIGAVDTAARGAS